MRHAYMYQGGFEANFSSLRPGATTFTGSDGREHPLPEWPAEVDGARVGYMEKPGKHFYGVRVMDGRGADIVLETPVLIDPTQHFGLGKRFGAEPTVVTDEMMLAFLKLAAKENPTQQNEIETVRNRIKAGGRAKDA